MSHSLHSLCAVFLFTCVEMLQSPPHSHIIDRSVTFEEYFRWSIMCGDGCLILPALHGKIGVSYASSAASHSLLHLHFPEKKSVSPFSESPLNQPLPSLSPLLRKALVLHLTRTLWVIPCFMLVRGKAWPDLNSTKAASVPEKRAA